MNPIVKLILLFFTFQTGLVFGQTEKNKIIIDADTGNEVDDLFAISRTS